VRREQERETAWEIRIRESTGKIRETERARERVSEGQWVRDEREHERREERERRRDSERETERETVERDWERLRERDREKGRERYI
jgi:hypothetical protein